jgi:hypothetical protein
VCHVINIDTVISLSNSFYLRKFPYKILFVLLLNVTHETKTMNGRKFNWDQLDTHKYIHIYHRVKSSSKVRSHLNAEEPFSSCVGTKYPLLMLSFFFSFCLCCRKYNSHCVNPFFIILLFFPISHNILSLKICMLVHV